MLFAILSCFTILIQIAAMDVRFFLSIHFFYFIDSVFIDSALYV